MTTITVANVEQKVREFAALAPDFIYTPRDGICHYYSSEKNPLGCIVGAALADLGTPVSASVESELDDEFSDTGAYYLLCHLDILGDDDEADWLTKVQRAQDQGYPWGEAVSLADEKEDQ